MVERELSAPGAGEVQIELKACAVNFTDLLMIQGKYQFKPPLPFAPGTEAAGDIVAVGEGVEDYTVGNRVVMGMRYGGFAESVLQKLSLARTARRHHLAYKRLELGTRVR